MDWERSGVLDGLEGEARDARLRLLERLHEDGVDEEELRRACEEDRLVLLGVERALTGPPRHTAAQVADRTGLETAWLERARRAMGLSIPAAEEVAYTDQDVDSAGRFRRYLETGLPTDDLMSGLRMIGSSVARAAEAVRAISGPALLEPGIDEDELARRYAAAADALLPLVEADLSHLLRVHLREQLRQVAISRAELHAGELSQTVETAVAFADLVGFTALGEDREPEVLGDVAALLLEHAEAVVAPPVRLIKTIGDAVMVAAPEPAPLLEALLELVDAVERDDRLPPLRAGVAAGTALQRFGDLYGSTVNLASRVCSRARPGAVLATADVREALADRFAWSHAGPKRLKGVGTVDTWRARRTLDREEAPAAPDPQD